MSVFQMVTIITVVAIVAGVVSDYLKKRQPKIDLGPIEDRLKQLEGLQQRVETLEAIVTDKGYNLKDEIDNLK